MPTLPKPERTSAPGKRHRVLNPVATPRLRGRKLQERNARLFRRNPLCVVCKAAGRLTAVDEWDHREQLSLGGGETAANLQGLCRTCHAAKTEHERAARGGVRGF